MRRRSLLATVGSALLAGTGGCLGFAGPIDDAGSPGARSSPSPTTDDHPEPSPTTDGDPTPSSDTGRPTPIPPDGERAVDEEPFEMEPAPPEPFERLALGDRIGVPNPTDNRPHEVVVWNGVDAPREMRLRATGIDAGELLVETFSFPAWGYLELILRWPDTYRVGCTVPETGTTGLATVPQTYFDCNASATSVGVLPEGSVKQTTVTTAMACLEPTPTA